VSSKSSISQQRRHIAASFVFDKGPQSPRSTLGFSTRNGRGFATQQTIARSDYCCNNKRSAHIGYSIFSQIHIRVIVSSLAVSQAAYATGEKERRQKKEKREIAKRKRPRGPEGRGNNEGGCLICLPDRRDSDERRYGLCPEVFPPSTGPSLSSPSPSLPMGKTRPIRTRAASSEQ